jgi:hypothetical protein
MFMFHFHAIFSLELIALALGVLILIFAHGNVLAKILGYLITIVALLNIACTGYYAAKFWSAGDFNRPYPMMMMQMMHGKMMSGQMMDNKSMPMMQEQKADGKSMPMMPGKMMQKQELQNQRPVNNQAEPSKQTSDATMTQNPVASTPTNESSATEMPQSSSDTSENDATKD